ncbi:MAG: hypothetical protein ACFFG0_08525 [Candidatus Thorarchaeota archaeon]
MVNTSLDSEPFDVMPVNRYHKSDSIQYAAFNLNTISLLDLKEKYKIEETIASQIISLRTKSPIKKYGELRKIPEISKRNLEFLRRCGIGSEDSKFAITDVQPAEDYIFSNKPFSLKISYLNPSKRSLALISIKVLWKGSPFIIERKITKKNLMEKYIIVNSNKEQTLPSGPATFLVNIFDKSGGQSSFKVTCLVLPSNPLTLSISPITYYVTGSYSARGVYFSGNDEYKTYIKISLYNGSSSPVNMSRNLKWQFWNGGVGGTLIESGNYTFSYDINVPANGEWSCTATFTSPNGSGIYNTYKDKEDMTIKIEMTKTDGIKVSDTITTRVMLKFNADIIRVASDTFIGQEYTDLYDAVEVTKSIYEARDITIGEIGRYHIDDNDAGNYKYMNSRDECRDLFEDWSADPSGSDIDTFVAHDFVGVSFDGFAGDIPGPTHHRGDESGVVVDKTGYVDSSGVKRLSVDYLGMLIGHELGHYLGLEHKNVAGNLMHQSSGTYDTDLTYDQYREILDYGWIFRD